MQASSHWLTAKAQQRGRDHELEEGRRAFRRGDACPTERWRKLGWHDASTQALRGHRLAHC